MRTWLYRIATNACLTALKGSSRRVLPSGLSGASDDWQAPPPVASPEVNWLQPIPDALVNPTQANPALARPESDDPATILASREGLRLGLIASLQYLTPRQRAVLILRDVLAFPAAEVAQILNTTTVAVKSTLQRARAQLGDLALTADQVTEPTEPQSRALLNQYIAAFENADVAALEQVLRHDATLEATPKKAWFAGRRTCIAFLDAWILGLPATWRMMPTHANGQPAAAAYTRDDSGTYHAYGVVVLTPTNTGITRIVSFGEPELVTTFGFPPVLQGCLDSGPHHSGRS